MQIKNVIFFANGNTACFDKDGEQVPECSHSWFNLFREYLEETKGMSIEGIEFEFPNGIKTIIKNKALYEKATRFYPGMQVAYISVHPDIEFGFIEKNSPNNCLCRYWRKGEPGHLRTVASGEWTKKDDLYLFSSVEQKIVDQILLKIRQSSNE